MKQWKIVYTDVYVSEYSDEEGELDFVSGFCLSDVDRDFSNGNTFNSLEEIIKAVNDIFGTRYTKKEFGVFDANSEVELGADFIVDNDDYYGGEYDSWKSGEIKLYIARVRIGLRVIEGERSATIWDFKEEGITTILHLFSFKRK